MIRAQVFFANAPASSPLETMPAQGISHRGLAAPEFAGDVGRRPAALDVLALEPGTIVELRGPRSHFVNSFT